MYNPSHDVPHLVENVNWCRCSPSRVMNTFCLCEFSLSFAHNLPISGRCWIPASADIKSIRRLQPSLGRDISDAIDGPMRTGKKWWGKHEWQR